MWKNSRVAAACVAYARTCRQHTHEIHTCACEIMAATHLCAAGHAGHMKQMSPAALRIRAVWASLVQTQSTKTLCGVAALTHRAYMCTECGSRQGAQARVAASGGHELRLQLRSALVHVRAAPAATALRRLTWSGLTAEKTRAKRPTRAHICTATGRHLHCRDLACMRLPLQVHV